MLRPRTVARFVESFPARTPTLPPATHTNAYALGGREVLLVEPATPYDDERAAWIAWVAGLRASGRTPVALFLTHHHPDHVGGARFLAKELALPIWAHDETAKRVDFAIDRRLTEGDAIALDGPTPQRWSVHHTPGHAPGHLCLLEDESRVAIVGDMVASEGTILIAPGEGDMGEYLRQLARMQTWSARVALPAHGEPIDDPNALFAGYVMHRLGRERIVVSAVRDAGAEGATAGELVATAYADTSPALWPIAVLSLRAHLEKLVREGTVRLDEGERFSLAEAS